MDNYRALVKENLEIAPEHYRMTLVPEQMPARIEPGRFLYITVTGEYDPLLRRPFSLFDVSPGERQLKIVYKLVGRGTELLKGLAAGSRVDIMGPLGTGFDIFNEGKDLLVAGGIGMAPLFYLARKLRERNKAVTFLLGARTKAGLLFVDELEELGVNTILATDDGSRGFKGTVGDLLAAYLQNNSRPDRLYCCGPAPVYKDVLGKAKSLRLPVQISYEERMACGVGACMGCVCKPESKEGYIRVCLDGPVINHTF